MHKISIKFVLISVAAIAACIATTQLPEVESYPYVVDATNPAPPEPESSGLDYTWLKIIAIFLGGAIFSNLIANCFGFRGFGKWIFGIGLPVCVMFGWYLVGLNNGTHGYGILGPYAPLIVFIAITMAFTIGFAIVHGVQAIASEIGCRSQQPIDA